VAVLSHSQGRLPAAIGTDAVGFVECVALRGPRFVRTSLIHPRGESVREIELPGVHHVSDCAVVEMDFHVNVHRAAARASTKWWDDGAVTAGYLLPQVSTLQILGNLYPMLEMIRPLR
jgi:hypothetical protein